MKDWVGNKSSAFATIGATGHALEERQEVDYYATDPIAMELLLEVETFNNKIWGPAVGEWHLANVLVEHGFDVRGSDIIKRTPNTEIIDFLEFSGGWEGDIITNPPYRIAQKFIEKSMEILDEGAKLALFLKLTFLESKGRKEMFLTTPPKTLYVSSSRISCAKNGDFDKYPSSAIAYGWYVWEKGFTGDTVIKWIN